jgi:hypothetical protein
MQKLIITCSIALLANLGSLVAQPISRNADFENISLPYDSFNNGSNRQGYFINANAWFQNKYDTSFGGFWSGGFAISTMRDSVTAGFTNPYSSIAATGANNSKTYAAAQSGAFIKVPAAIPTGGSFLGSSLKSIYVSNSTYAYLSMKNGDVFAKKFGGVSGNDPDWFKLSIAGHRPDSSAHSAHVDFYLADFRDSNNANDYIVRGWTKIDLSALGRCDTVQFMLSSSDTGSFGMNTPGFFCVDEFEFTDFWTAVREVSSIADLRIFPNPSSDYVHVHSSNKIEHIALYNLNGSILMEGVDNLNLSALDAGVYLLKVQSGDAESWARIVRN